MRARVTYVCHDDALLDLAQGSSGRGVSSRSRRFITRPFESARDARPDVVFVGWRDAANFDEEGLGRRGDFPSPLLPRGLILGFHDRNGS